VGWWSIACGGAGAGDSKKEIVVASVEQATSTNGAACAVATDCTSGYCDNSGHCAACTSDGNCAQGTLGAAGGQYCSNAGVCTARKPDGAICNASSQCSGPGCYAARQCINGCCDGLNVCHGYATGDKLCAAGRRCDDGNPCHSGGIVGGTNPKTCTGFTSLANGSSCNPDTASCTADVCNGGTCTHPAGNAGVTCRASAGPCDVPESCSGTSTTCPPNTFAPSTTTCRAAAGECDAAETCSGASATCPADAKKAGGTPCTDDGDACTSDTCDGSTVTCQHSESSVNTDGDALSDCREDGDANPTTDKHVFNGMDVRTKPQCSSVGSCSENDTYAEVTACMAGPVDQELNQWSGWNWNNPPDNRCDPGYQFSPNWTSCSNAWQADWKGYVHFITAGKQCFNITGGSSEGCAALYFNGNAAGADAQTGSATKCFDVQAGAYPIEWHYTMDNGSTSSLHVNYCFGGSATCTPTAVIPYQMLTTQLLAGDRCSSASQCASGLCLHGTCGAGFACASSGDADGDGTLDCLDGCPHDATKVDSGDCGCSDKPRPAGTPCDDGICTAATQCDGAGVCGGGSACAGPDAHCHAALRAGAAYWFCEDERSFADASSRCQAAGMQLASVDSADEDIFIGNNTTEHAYLGGSDQAVEGTWVWTSTGQTFWTGGLGGTPAAGSYTNWETGQPSDVGGADCLVKDPPIGHGKWETRGCSTLQQYVCKRAPVVAPPPPPIVPTPIPGGLIPAGPLCPALSNLDGQGLITIAPPNPSIDPTVCATQSFCAPGTNQPLNPQPTADQINQPPGPNDSCAAVPPLPQCPVNPSTLAGPCQTDADCSSSQVCAIVCSDVTCTTIDRRCGTPDVTKCGGTAADKNCKTIWVCPDPDYTGDPTPTGDLTTHPTDPGADHPPASGMPPVYQPGDPCVLAVDGTSAPDGHLALSQSDLRTPRSGNRKWGITAEPKIVHNLDAKALPLGEISLNAEASASFKSTATIWGKDVPIIDTEIGAKVTDCELDVFRKLELFGTPTTVLGNPPTFSTSSTLQTACIKAMEAYTDLGNEFKKSIFDLKQMLDYVKQVGGVTPDFCDMTNQHFSNINQPANIPCNEAALNAWVAAYRKAAGTFVMNHAGPTAASLESVREAMAIEPGGLGATGGTFPFVNVGQHFDATVVRAQLFVGPVPIAVEFGVRGSWGVDGSLDVNLDHAGESGTASLGANANVTPHAEASAYGFAGVGITGFVEIGLTGDITLFGASVPLHTGISLVRNQADDGRDPLTSTVVDAASGAYMFPKISYGWKGSWNFGAGLTWHTLDGSLGARARIGVDLGFVSFHISYETEIAHWTGFSSGPKNLVGASYAVPITGLPDFGAFEDQIVFPDTYPVLSVPVVANNPAVTVPQVSSCHPPIP
jgi:hypothetical protein